jgi:hypothetical protein
MSIWEDEEMPEQEIDVKGLPEVAANLLPVGSFRH